MPPTRARRHDRPSPTAPPRRPQPQCPAPPARSNLTRIGAGPRRPHEPAPRPAGAPCRQLGDNPLQALFGAAIVALLIFTLTGINDRSTRVEDRIARLENRIDARFAQVDARFAALGEDVAEINLKLTAIIAALNMTEDVSAALEGRIIDRSPNPDPAGYTPG